MAKTNNILQSKPQSVRVLFFLSYVVFVYFLILYAVQDTLIFHPDRNYISPSQVRARNFRELPLRMSDGTTVMTWLAKGDKNKPALLFFHGNAGQIATFAPELVPFISNGYTVMVSGYRGFPNSSGHLSEKALISDAVTMYDYLREWGYREVISFGYSFGSAIAIGLASQRPVSGLILVAPFKSLEDMVAEVPLPFARYLLRDSYRSDRRVSSIYVPTLILHGKVDRIIPYHQAEQLYYLLGSPNKKLVLLPDATHSSVYFSGKAAPLVLKWLQN